jgi:adenosylmethionine-8-amino-7-oxononanoate aminotransferase
MEPIIAGGGVLLPPDDYLPRVREICTRHGVLLILDEVVTGFCRTGARFAHQHAGVRPDIITLAKGIASGYVPLAATVVSDEIFAAFDGEPGGLDHFRHINTYAGHPVATAVALRNIEILERECLAENATRMGAHLLARLAPLREHPNVGDVRGKGLLLGIELVSDRNTREPLAAQTLLAITQRCAEEGVIVGRTTNATPNRSNVLILAPPLILAEDEADLIARTLEDALFKVLPADAAAR